MAAGVRGRAEAGVEICDILGIWVGVLLSLVGVGFKAALASSFLPMYSGFR